jgi:hypothetical protein
LFFSCFDGGRGQKQKQGIGRETFAPSFARRRMTRAALYFFASY